MVIFGQKVVDKNLPHFVVFFLLGEKGLKKARRCENEEAEGGGGEEEH